MMCTKIKRCVMAPLEDHAFCGNYPAYDHLKCTVQDVFINMSYNDKCIFCHECIENMKLTLEKEEYDVK